MSAVLDAPPITTPTQRAHRRSAMFVRWLRKIHLYVGLWGAALGLLFGLTGILMNHRAVMKIPVEKMVQKSAQLKLPEHEFANADEMARWLQAELRFEQAEHSRVKVDPPKALRWGDREVQQPARWTFNWQSPTRAVNAEYFVGNRSVKVETQDATQLGTLMRLHMASGAGAFWVLLADTIAGGMILLSLTGVLLWTRLHPIKLSAAVASLGALVCAVFYLMSAA